jgi:hypothetical protein
VVERYGVGSNLSCRQRHHAAEEDYACNDSGNQNPIIECTTEKTSLTGAALSDSVKLPVYGR